jgi:hypothetical protein
VLQGSPCPAANRGKTCHRLRHSQPPDQTETGALQEVPTEKYTIQPIALQGSPAYTQGESEKTEDRVSVAQDVSFVGGDRLTANHGVSE